MASLEGALVGSEHFRRRDQAWQEIQRQDVRNWLRGRFVPLLADFVVISPHRFAQSFFKRRTQRGWNKGGDPASHPTPGKKGLAVRENAG